nr:cation transporter [Congzhengia minquanensis]
MKNKKSERVVIVKKTFLLEDLDCAHCAAKIEDAVSKIDGVEKATVNFLKSNITVEAPEEAFSVIMKKAAKAVSKIEPDCTIKGV